MGLYSEGIIIGRIFASKNWGAYLWGAYYRNFPGILDKTFVNATIRRKRGQDANEEAILIFSQLKQEHENSSDMVPKFSLDTIRLQTQ